MQHLSDEHLENYLLAKIPQGIELIVVEEHLYRCPECFSRFQRTEAYFRVMEVDLDGARKPLREALKSAALALIDELRINKRLRLS